MKTTQPAPVYTFPAWLWPDHTIGKADSRHLREEHNSLVNAFDLLTQENQRLREALAKAEQHLRFLGSALPDRLAACHVCTEIAEEARQALSGEGREGM